MGADFCHPMLVTAAKKGGRALVEADMLMLLLRDASIDVVTVAFGFRKLANYEHGPMEMRRILRSGA